MNPQTPASPGAKGPLGFGHRDRGPQRARWGRQAVGDRPRARRGARYADHSAGREQRGSPSGMEALGRDLGWASGCSPSPPHILTDHRWDRNLRANVNLLKSGFGGTVLLWSDPCAPYKLGRFLGAYLPRSVPCKNFADLLDFVSTGKSSLTNWQTLTCQLANPHHQLANSHLLTGEFSPPRPSPHCQLVPTFGNCPQPVTTPKSTLATVLTFSKLATVLNFPLPTGHIPPSPTGVRDPLQAPGAAGPVDGGVW